MWVFPLYSFSAPSDHFSRPGREKGEGSIVHTDKVRIPKQLYILKSFWLIDSSFLTAICNWRMSELLKFFLRTNINIGSSVTKMKTFKPENKVERNNL